MFNGCKLRTNLAWVLGMKALKVEGFRVFRLRVWSFKPHFVAGMFGRDCVRIFSSKLVLDCTGSLFQWDQVALQAVNFGAMCRDVQGNQEQ